MVRVLDLLQQIPGAIGILNIGGVDDDAQEQSQDIDRDMALASLHLLGGIVAARAAFFRGLDALGVDDHGGRAGLPAFALTECHDQIMADGFPDPGVQKGPKVAVDRLPRRERRRRWNVAPLAPGAHDIEQTVQHAPHVGRPGPTTGLRRRDERLDQTILIIAQGLTGAKISNQCAIFGRPHRSLQKEGVSSSEQPET